MRTSLIVLGTVSTLVLSGVALAQTARRAAPPPAFPPLATLPAPPIPVDNPQTPEKIELGKLLFFDNRLSGNGAMGCVACHRPELGWGTASAISFGYPGTIHWRNSQTILNAAYYNKGFWEGSVTSLEGQAPSAAGGAVAGNGDDALMEMRLAFVPEYRAAFRKVFGTEYPMLYDAWRAVSAFQRTIVTDAKKVPFDRFLAGDRTALSAEAQRGLALYNGKAGCIACHNGPLASDQKFYRTGVPDPADFASEPIQQITQRWQAYQKGVPEPVYRTAATDHGLYYITKRPDEIGRWRTPSLRELKWTGPYMHSGVFETLEQVVDFYDKGGGKNAERLRPLGLSAQEKKDLVAFLDSLSMTEPLIVPDPVLPETKPLWTR
jgi:cytochrome c peroxidase